MEVALAIAVGCIYTTALYMLMHRSIVRWIIGLGLLSHGANLLIFCLGRLTRQRPPIIPEGAESLQPPYADPLPQALILTAIVIGFGVQAYAVVLVKRIYQTLGTDDLDQMTSTDRECL